MTLKNKSVRKRRIIIAAVVAVILVSLIAFFIIRRNQNSEVTSNPSTTQEEDKAAIQQGESPKNQNAVSSPETDKQAGSNASGASVSAPEGNFVSSHKINSLSSTIESVCRTTKGASCEITFVQSGVTKSLGKKTADSNGTATWIWTPGAVGLSNGSWEITASATLNSSTQTSKDPMNLEISI
jgi:uncharacterized protein YneF (UPF0154 family)